MSPVTGVPMNLVPFILIGVCVAVLVVAGVLAYYEKKRKKDEAEHPIPPTDDNAPPLG